MRTRTYYLNRRQVNTPSQANIIK